MHLAKCRDEQVPVHKSYYWYYLFVRLTSYEVPHDFSQSISTLMYLWRVSPSKREYFLFCHYKTVLYFYSNTFCSPNFFSLLFGWLTYNISIFRWQKSRNVTDDYLNMNFSSSLIVNNKTKTSSVRGNKCCRSKVVPLMGTGTPPQDHRNVSFTTRKGILFVHSLLVYWGPFREVGL